MQTRSQLPAILKLWTPDSVKSRTNFTVAEYQGGCHELRRGHLQNLLGTGHDNCFEHAITGVSC